MERIRFGSSGIDVPRLGLGAGALGGSDLSEAEVRRLLGRAIDAGVDLIDAARSYGEAESRIGRHVAGLRDRVLLSTKIGYGVDGVRDWTGPCVTAGVELALRALQTDRIDIVHLHSCPREVLEAGEVVDALEAARAAGKVRVVAYSGDGDALDWAVDSGRFGAVQASFNLCDRANRATLERARGRGVGTIAKRALANAAWRGPSPGAEPYADRWTELALDLGTEDPAEVALRYVIHHAPADVALVGTRTFSHLEAAVTGAEAGPLDPAALEQLERRWTEVGSGWAAHI